MLSSLAWRTHTCSVSPTYRSYFLGLHSSVIEPRSEKKIQSGAPHILPARQSLHSQSLCAYCLCYGWSGSQLVGCTKLHSSSYGGPPKGIIVFRLLNVMAHGLA